jgi:multidrug resistance protein, MATE family
MAHLDGESNTRTLRTLLSLAWPIVLGRASQSVIGFTDALMVAPLGDEALAAVTTGALNSFAAIILPMGTVFIVQSFTSQLRGRGDLDGARRYAWYGLIISLLAALLGAASIPFAGQALGVFEYEPRVHALMTEYLIIRLLSVGPAVATEALGNWYGGMGNTRPAMIAGVTAMVTNVIGCWLLIEPHFGLPGYGVAGSAWASTIATTLGFLTLFVPFLLNGKGAGKLGFKLSELLRMLRFGIPNGVNWFLEFSAFVLFINLVVGHLGTATLAAFNVVLQINSVSFMPAFGLASSGAILVGEAIGARRFDAARAYVILTLKVAALWMVSVGLVYMAFPATLMGWFGSREGDVSELVKVGTTMLFLGSFWQLFDAVSITLSEALRAAGDTTWCMLARVVFAWFVFVPVGWFAVVKGGGGAEAVMFAVMGYIFLLAVAFGFRFLSGKWQNIDLIGKEPSLLD